MAVESTRSRQLRKLADQLPGANQSVARGLQAGRETQLQETIRQARPVGPRQAQALGTQQAQQSGQIQLQAARQTQQDMGAVGQMAGQQQQLESQQRIGEQQRGVSKKQRELVARLQRLDEDAKNKLLDRQLEFQQDERGRQFLNERQLADWAVANAKSEEEFAKYKQQAMQMHDKKIAMLKTANAKLQQALKQNYIIEGQQLDNAQRLKIQQDQRALQQKLAQEAAKRAEKQAMWQAGGTIIGTVAGAFGGPAGAAAGGQLGGAIGGGAGAAFG